MEGKAGGWGARAEKAKRNNNKKKEKPSKSNKILKKNQNKAKLHKCPRY